MAGGDAPRTTGFKPGQPDSPKTPGFTAILGIAPIRRIAAILPIVPVPLMAGMARPLWYASSHIPAQVRTNQDNQRQSMTIRQADGYFVTSPESGTNCAKFLTRLTRLTQNPGPLFSFLSLERGNRQDSQVKPCRGAAVGSPKEAGIDPSHATPGPGQSPGRWCRRPQGQASRLTGRGRPDSLRSTGVLPWLAVSVASPSSCG
jgi:hypothetical protein